MISLKRLLLLASQGLVVAFLKSKEEKVCRSPAWADLSQHSMEKTGSGIG